MTLNLPEPDIELNVLGNTVYVGSRYLFPELERGTNAPMPPPFVKRLSTRRQYRLSPVRLKPGSLTADGAVVDWQWNIKTMGSCFVPEDFGVRDFARRRRRLSLAGKAGWCVCPAADWPSIMPSQGLVCIVRKRA